MKQLTRLLLVNWHYYSKEWIDFEQINFLTGKTGAGKSTLVDALQILLLGDTNGAHFFNKAANDRSRRSLKGYLRGEFGDDGGSGYLYLRNGPFSTYLVAEFHDTEKNSDFACGVVFDCNYSANDDSCFFIIKDRIPEHAFTRKDIALEIKDLKQYLRQTYERRNFDICTTAREYQTKLIGLFGGLNSRYFTLMKKAVSFTPIIDIEEFITHNICDSKRPPDLSGMQDNLRSYRKLEHEAEQMTARIHDLEQLGHIHASLQEERQRLTLYRFLIDRADQESASRQLAAAEQELARTQADLARSLADGERLAVELLKLQEQREQLIEQRGQNDIYQRQQALQAEKARLDQQIAELEGSVTKLVGQFNESGLVWRRAAEEADQFLKTLTAANTGAGASAAATATGATGASAAISAGALNLPLERETAAWQAAIAGLRTVSEQLLDLRRSNVSGLSQASLKACQNASEQFKESRQPLQLRLLHEQDLAAKAVEDHEDRITDLKANNKGFDKKITWFRDELVRTLSARHGRIVTVDVLADLLEIPEPRWTNVIEGYINNQKQYLMVEPGYYVEALEIYDQMRRRHDLYSVSLIDGEKVLAKSPVRLPGSLAEEIVTDHPQARAYIDFLLGRVIKCDRIEDLRKHERAVTDSGLLYQGFVTSSIHPDLWKLHYIGKRAIFQQIERLEAELPQLRERAAAIARLAAQARALRSIEAMSSNDIANALFTLERTAILPRLAENRQAIVTQLGQLDLSWILKLNMQIEKLRTEIQGIELAARQNAETTGSHRRAADQLEQGRIPECRSRCRAAEEVLRQRYAAEFRQGGGEGELRFQSELASKQTPERIATDFRPQLGLRQNAIDTLEKDLTNARAAYNRAFNYSFDVDARSDNRRYDQQLQALRDEQLPQYAARIAAAKAMAYEQFASQFLAEMKNSILEVRTRIDELNRALRTYRWGNERFSFQITENPDYKRFYDMINDPMLMEGYTLMSQLFLDKHGPAVDELFNRIVDLGPEMDADARTEIEKNIKLFTDYKTYLRFDMISIDENDNRQRLSRTLLKKSGGETQTPFYIAMLASFAQLYHVNDRKWNTLRLIIFDEAFSKMDGERIRESIQMLKAIGFQCILSAPPEKIGDIAPLVDRNIAVIKRGHASFTRAFDSRHLIAAYAEAAEEESEV